MRRLLCLLYLWWKDPIGTCCRENYAFDEYSPEVDEIIRTERTEENVQKIFNKFFSGINCPLDDKVVQSGVPSYDLR